MVERTCRERTCLPFTLRSFVAKGVPQDDNVILFVWGLIRWGLLDDYGAGRAAARAGVVDLIGIEL